MKPRPVNPIKKTRIDLSEKGMRIEFIPGGAFPELSFIHNQPDGTMLIGFITKMEDLRKLKAALQDVV